MIVSFLDLVIVWKEE